MGDVTRIKMKCQAYIWEIEVWTCECNLHTACETQEYAVCLRASVWASVRPEHLPWPPPNIPPQVLSSSKTTGFLAIFLFISHILETCWKLSQRANLSGFPALTVPLPFWKHKTHSWSKSFFPMGNWIQTLAHLCRPVIKSAVQVTSATGSGDRQNEMWKKWHLFLGCFSEKKVLAATQWSPCDQNTRASSGPASWLQNSSSRSRAIWLTRHLKLNPFAGGLWLPQEIFSYITTSDSDQESGSSLTVCHNQLGGSRKSLWILS